MAWFLLFVMFWSSFYMYGRWLGYFSLLRDGDKQRLFDVPRDWNWRPRVSFMIPSFNEGSIICQTIDSIMASDYPKECIEILVVDDCSPDDTWAWIEHMRDKYPQNVIAWKNEPNKGKPFTLVDIIRRATGAIVFTVDSDTIIAPDAIKEMVSCYADPNIGAVGGQVRVRNLNDSLWTQMQGMLYANLHYLVKTLENQFLTSRCLCGPLASFRHEVFSSCQSIILNRSFLSVKPIKCGEDAYITTRVSLGNGLTQRWKVFTNMHALAWTDNPATTIAYFNQQLRWWRGSQLNGTFVLSTLFQNFRKAGFAPTMVTLVTAMCVYTSFMVLLYFWLMGWFVNLILLVTLNNAVIGIVRCWVFNLVIGKKDPVAGKIKNPVLTGLLYGGWSLCSWFILSIMAIWTMDDGGWVTRQDGHKNIG